MFCESISQLAKCDLTTKLVVFETILDPIKFPTDNFDDKFL